MLVVWQMVTNISGKPAVSIFTYTSILKTEATSSSKMLVAMYGLHDITFQKTAVMETSVLKRCNVCTYQHERVWHYLSKADSRNISSP
jgi:hypothetical protein